MEAVRKQLQQQVLKESASPYDTRFRRLIGEQNWSLLPVVPWRDATCSVRLTRYG